MAASLPPPRRRPTRRGGCRLCGFRCGARRARGERGRCALGPTVRVASFSVHCGEEPCISGTRGSGNIFFSGCVLHCVFCQNFPISQYRYGRDLTVAELARGMVGLQRQGCHNINLVSATSFYPQIKKAVALARRQGLRLPILTNTGGFETPQTVRSLSAWVDIYLPDMKYADPALAKRLSGAADYVEVNRQAVLEMWRCAGPLRLGRNGLARRGLLIRHLVLPGQVENSRAVLRWIAATLGPTAPLSLMRQYFPAYRAHRRGNLARKVSRREYRAVVDEFFRLGFSHGYLQEDE